MIGQSIDTMMLASTVVVMTHQTLSLEKYWKLFPATLNNARKAVDGFQSFSDTIGNN